MSAVAAAKSEMSANPREEILAEAGGRSWTAEEAAAMEAWHHRCVERTFGGRESAEAWGRLLFTPGIDEPEWNHASGIDWRESEVDAQLASVESAFTAVGRTPAVTVTPWSKPADLARNLENRDWSVCFRHLWSFYDLARPVEVAAIAPYRYTRVETPEQMEEFVELFVSVYGAEGELAAGYAPALRRSRGQPGVRHHLIRFEDAAVAIGTLLVEGDHAQIFNMVVLEGHRRRGLAEWLTEERLREARESGASRLTALSDNARIDRWLFERGFVPGWFSVGYARAPVPGSEQ